jgi:hypothetical protein
LDFFLYIKEKFNNSPKIKKEKKSYKDIKYLGQGKQKLHKIINYCTKILFYYYIVLIGFFNIPILIITAIISAVTLNTGPFLIGLIIVSIIIIMHIIIAIRQVLMRKKASNEFIFDKKKKVFTKSRIKSKNRRRIKEKIPLSDIKLIIMKKYLWKHPYSNSVNYETKLKLNNNDEIKLFKSSNLQEIEKYCNKLAKYLGLKIKQITTEFGYVPGP